MSRRPAPFHPSPFQLLFLALLCACGAPSPAPDAGDVDASSPRRWANPSSVPEPPPARFFSDRPWLLDTSAWSARIARSGPRLLPAQLPDFGVGNGDVFALLGYGPRASTLHGMIGPDYQKGSGFFVDTWVEAVVDGAVAEPREEHVLRVRRTPIVITRAIAPSVELYTIDLAPRAPKSTPARDVDRAIVRRAVVRNPGSAAIADVRLRVRFAAEVQPSGDRVEDARDDDRRSTWVLAGGAAKASTTGLEVQLGALAPGEEREVAIAWVTWKAARPADADATLAALRSASLDALAEETRDAWRAFADDGLRLSTPEPLVDDLLDGARVSIEVQRARSGAVSQMSQYTKTWMRDVIGPVRFYARAGHLDEARAMVDYLMRAAHLRGDLDNSYRLDLDPAPPEPAVDWDALPPLAGLVAAETPSYLVLAALEVFRATGDADWLRARWPLLRSCVRRQAPDAEGLLPFTGDETFRTAMSVAFDLPPAFMFEEKAWSANSAFLFVAAAEGLARAADAVGLPADQAADLRARATTVRTATVARYAIPAESTWAPFILRPDGAAPARRADAPFEDVSTQPLWLGWSRPEDPGAVENVRALARLLGRPGGFLQSAPAYPLGGKASEQGVYTGMVPGFWLWNLSAAAAVAPDLEPLAEDAFDALAATCSASGSWGEYHTFADHRPLQLVYDPLGVAGDYTARLRTWEAGIDVDAMLFHLLGMRVEAPGGEPTFAPRLPHGWDGFRATGLRVGDRRWDVEIVREQGRPVARATPRHL